ncbi:MAG TPA: sugar phosphate isomerase/epimerase [Planctomycetaceae bacterium]|jgi:D-psicose/D-tagatose/L-ribulose 3-epimerase|nr:sugar phosphate isomerase/epimerase [Planctomycetaceae bacterium]
MKYGMNMLLWTTNVDPSHDSVFEMLKETGYDGVEIPIFQLEEPSFQRIGKKLDSLKLDRTTVACVGAAVNPISADAGIRKASLEHLKKCVDLSRVCGSKLMAGPFHSAIGEFTGKGPTSDEWQRGKEFFANLADYAKQAGVTLVLEYLNRFECYFLNTAADTARFCREVNHPNLRMMYDSFHANIEEKDIAKAIRDCAPYTVHVHISENDRGTPGEGHVDWDTTFATLKETKYDGWMVVEAFGLALPDLAAATKIWRRMFPSEEHLSREALRFMKSRWAG